MPETFIDAQIRARIDAFVVEIGTLVRQAAVEAVRDALHGSAPAAPARATRAGARRKPGPKPGRKAAKAKASGKRIRRSGEDLERQGATLLDFVRQNAGARMEAISAALGESTKDLRRPVQALIEAGKLRTQGQKRATQYFVGGGRGRPAKKASRKKKAGRRKGRAKAR